MNILMVTNTYTPLVGGLERSVKNFTEECYRLQVEWEVLKKTAHATGALLNETVGDR